MCANSITERANSISSLIYQYPDSAYSLAQGLMNDALYRNDKYGIVQSNFILAFIHDEIREEYGKAIIYYLEAIRHADQSTYEHAKKDLISLHKNCGAIFRKFKVYSLAEEYYNKALAYALEIQNNEKKLSINFNIANLFMDQKRYKEAVKILDDLIVHTHIDSKNYWKYSNRLGIVLYESGDFEAAIDAHNNSLAYSSLSNELRGYTIHNIGKCFASLDDFENAYSYFYQALQIKHQLDDKSALFSTYSELGDLVFRNGDVKMALYYFDEAEKYIDQITDINRYELLKSKADVLFALKKFNEAKKYGDLYAERLNDYLKIQEKIQQADKSINMNLITKRYFDNVDRQERISSILFYSKLISGTLLGLLLFTIGFNRYRKAQLRKSIVKSLIDFKFID